MPPASESDFTQLQEAGDTIASQWPGLVRAVESLTAYFRAKDSTGTEPADLLRAILFGDGTIKNRWRLIAAGTSNIQLMENVGTEAAPVWVSLAMFTSTVGAAVGLVILNRSMRLTPAAGDPAVVSDGDVWYNATTGKFRKREGGVTSDLDTTGATPPFIDLEEQSPVPGSPAANVARLYAVDEDGVTRLDYKTSDGGIVRLARDTVLVVQNQTGSSIVKGQAVYISSGTPGQIRVALAQANAETTMPAVGLVLDTSIAHGSNGRVMIGGRLTNLNTSSFSEGDRLFVSAATPGALTATEPASPNLSQRVAVVLVSHGVNGELLVLPLSIKRGITEIEVNFGSTPTIFKSFTVTDSSVTAASRILVGQSGNAPSGRSADENEMDRFTAAARPGSGSFTLHADSQFGPVTGLYKFFYTVGV